MQAAPEPAPELEDLAALRARIRAGDGTAAWKMINHVHTCASATLLDDARSWPRCAAPPGGPCPRKDGIDRALRELTAKDHEQQALRRMRELRHHCPQLRRDDGERLLDWLEVALAAGEEDFLYRLSIPGGCRCRRTRPGGCDTPSAWPISLSAPARPMRRAWGPATGGCWNGRASSTKTTICGHRSMPTRCLSTALSRPVEPAAHGCAYLEPALGGG